MTNSKWLVELKKILDNLILKKNISQYEKENLTCSWIKTVRYIISSKTSYLEKRKRTWGKY